MTESSQLTVKSPFEREENSLKVSEFYFQSQSQYCHFSPVCEGTVRAFLPTQAWLTGLIYSVLLLLSKKGAHYFNYLPGVNFSKRQAGKELQIVEWECSHYARICMNG